MSKILKTLKGPLSTFAKNRNGRIYTQDLWEGVLKSEYWQDMMKHNTLCGEVVHPGERTESDPLEIDVRNISHRISEAHIEGNKLMGTIEVLDTVEGRNLVSLIDSGCIVGISARGTGDLDGDYVVPESYQFKCFDITMRPSDPNARLIPLTESERKTKIIFKESEITDELIINEEEVLKGSEVPNDSDIRFALLKTLYSALLDKNKEGFNYEYNINTFNSSIQVMLDEQVETTINVGLIKNEEGQASIGVYASPLFGVEYVKPEDLHNAERYKEIANLIIENLKKEN